jgi:hypothetical protein
VRRDAAQEADQNVRLFDAVPRPLVPHRRGGGDCRVKSTVRRKAEELGNFFGIFYGDAEEAAPRTIVRAWFGLDHDQLDHDLLIIRWSRIIELSDAGIRIPVAAQSGQMSQSKDHQ